jgi:hypothetical protein
VLILALALVYPLTPSVSARPLGDAPPTLLPTQPPDLKVRRGGQNLNAQIAVVSDDLTPAGDIVVTVLSTPPGVTITNIVNSNGIVTADLMATCDGQTGNQDAMIQASDGTNTVSAILRIVVQGHTAPTTGTYGPVTVIVGGSVQNTPSVPPSANGTVTSVTVAVTSPAGFTGTISVDPMTGVVSVTNAGPVNVYTVTVTVTDDCGVVSTTTFTLDVQAPGNAIPIADAGADQAFNSCDFLLLIGSGSSDPDNGPAPLTYSWIQTSGTPVIIYNDTTSTPFIQAPNVATMEDLTFQLTVSDSVAMSSDSVTISVTHVNDVHVDTVGLFLNGANTFFLHNCNGYGPADNTFTFGANGFIPLSGDWDNDGFDSIGVYDPSSGCFFLRNSNSSGPADITVCFGPPNAVPLVGDWDNDGDDTIGIYFPSTSEFFLRNSNDSGPADTVFQFGGPGSGAVPIVGDWNGDGMTTVGLYIPSAAVFFLRNSNTPGAADLTFQFGSPDPTNTVPVVGNWDGLGGDSVGLYIKNTGVFFLSNTNMSGSADIVFQFGVGGNFTPRAGNWDNL